MRRQRTPRGTDPGRRAINHQFFSVLFDRNSRHPVMHSFDVLPHTPSGGWVGFVPGFAQRGLRPTKDGGWPVGAACAAPLGTGYLSAQVFRELSLRTA
jgi:hypothetical protein